MKRVISLSKQKLTIDDITDFEKEFNVFLPFNYKTLILKFNGGTIENSNNIDHLYSIKHGKTTVEYLIQVHQIWENNIPKEYLPIASDAAGNPITLCLKEGNEYGKIYAFLFDVGRVEKIANSLEELLGVKNIDEFNHSGY